MVLCHSSIQFDWMLETETNFFFFFFFSLSCSCSIWFSIFFAILNSSRFVQFTYLVKIHCHAFVERMSGRARPLIRMLLTHSPGKQHKCFSFELVNAAKCVLSSSTRLIGFHLPKSAFHSYIMHLKYGRKSFVNVAMQSLSLYLELPISWRRWWWWCHHWTHLVCHTINTHTHWMAYPFYIFGFFRCCRCIVHFIYDSFEAYVRGSNAHAKCWTRNQIRCHNIQ